METETTTKKSFPELSVDTRILYERLIKVPLDGIVHYKELSDLIGRNVQRDVRYFLSTARRKAMNENRIIFGPVRNIGLKRLNDLGKIAIGESTIEHVRRASKTGIKKILCVENFNDLPNAEKVRHNMHLSMLGVFYGLTKRKNIKYLESKIEQAQDKLSLVKTLEMFIKQDSRPEAPQEMS